MKEDKYVKLFFSHHAFGEAESDESAWAIKKGEYYLLDNILFYAKSYSLGDIIRAEERNGVLYAKELVQESGHSTIRVLLSDATSVDKIRAEFFTLGCPSELSNLDNLIAVDVPVNVSYAKVKKILEDGELKNLWEYQEACLAKKHSEEIE